MQHCSQGAKCIQGTVCELPSNTPFEADELVKGLKIENRNIICHKRLTPGNCHKSLPWQQAKHVKINEICFQYATSVSKIFCCLCVALIRENDFYPLKKILKGLTGNIKHILIVPYFSSVYSRRLQRGYFSSTTKPKKKKNNLGLL